VEHTPPFNLTWGFFEHMVLELRDELIALRAKPNAPSPNLAAWLETRGSIKARAEALGKIHQTFCGACNGWAHSANRCVTWKRYKNMYGDNAEILRHHQTLIRTVEDMMEGLGDTWKRSHHRAIDLSILRGTGPDPETQMTATGAAAINREGLNIAAYNPSSQPSQPANVRGVPGWAPRDPRGAKALQTELVVFAHRALDALHEVQIMTDTNLQMWDGTPTVSSPNLALVAPIATAYQNSAIRQHQVANDAGPHQVLMELDMELLAWARDAPEWIR
jgi:hypothetical protein